MVRTNRIREALDIIKDDQLVERILEECFQDQLNSKAIQALKFEDHIENGKQQKNKVSDLPVSELKPVDEMVKVFG